jgi:serine kinase of HPr protein (carbohydrate metabolism regulator)
MTALQVHASCVAFGSRAVLIRGKSGSGKSDLVLRLIDSEGFGIGDRPLRAKLVADDQVILTKMGKTLLASPPPTIAGKLEIRGVGILEMPWVGGVALQLVVDLMPFAEIPRMPEAPEMMTSLLGANIRCLALDPSQPSAPARIRSALL